MFGVHIAVERRTAARRVAGPRGRGFATAALAALFALAPASTVLATDNGLVPVTVTGSAAACITISDQALYAFGTLHFSTGLAAVSDTAPSSVMVTDCSGLAQTLEARVFGISSNNGDKALWTPIDASDPATNPCTVGPDKFIFKVGNSTMTQIAGTLTDVDSLSANNAGQKEWGALTMPCTGSSGASDAMSGGVEIVAVIP